MVLAVLRFPLLGSARLAKVAKLRERSCMNSKSPVDLFQFRDSAQLSRPNSSLRDSAHSRISWIVSTISDSAQLSRPNSSLRDSAHSRIAHNRVASITAASLAPVPAIGLLPSPPPVSRHHRGQSCAQIHLATRPSLATSTTLVPRPTEPKIGPDPLAVQVHLTQSLPRSSF